MGTSAGRVGIHGRCNAISDQNVGQIVDYREPPKPPDVEASRVRRSLITFVAVPIAWLLWGILGSSLLVHPSGRVLYFSIAFISPAFGAAVLAGDQDTGFLKGLVFVTTLVGYFVVGYWFAIAMTQWLT